MRKLSSTEPRTTMDENVIARRFFSPKQSPNHSVEIASHSFAVTKGKLFSKEV